MPAIAPPGIPVNNTMCLVDYNHIQSYFDTSDLISWKQCHYSSKDQPFELWKARNNN